MCVRERVREGLGISLLRAMSRVKSESLPWGETRKFALGHYVKKK